MLLPFSHLSKIPLGKAAKQIPVLGQLFGLYRTASKVYNSTNPVQAIPLAVLDIVKECSPPQVKFPLECGALLIQLAICISTGGNPFSIACALALGKQIVEKKL